MTRNILLLITLFLSFQIMPIQLVWAADEPPPDEQPPIDAPATVGETVPLIETAPIVENVPAAESPAPAAVIPDEEIDHATPPYNRVQPSKALGMRLAISKFPVKTAIGASYQIFGELILPWQTIGVISAGLHAGFLPLSTSDNSVDRSIFSNMLAGVQVGYQMKFWKSQPIIPIIGFDWEYIRLKPGNGSDTRISLFPFGVSFGALLSLTMFDSYTARDSYDSLGMSHAFLSLELQPLSISTPTLDISGYLWFWGLRLEFE